MADPERIVVIGADAAGMSAAHQALRTAKAGGRAIEVVALETDTRDTSYSACGIPSRLAGDVDTADDLVARSVERAPRHGRRPPGTGVTATGVDLAAHQVTYVDEAGAAGSLAFDQLVIARSRDRPVVPEWALAPDGTPYGQRGAGEEPRRRRRVDLPVHEAVHRAGRPEPGAA